MLPSRKPLIAATVLWAAVYTVYLAVLTLRIRHVNADDLRFDALTHAHTLLATGWSDAVTQGRFYMPIAYLAPAAFYSVSAPWLFAGLRALLTVAAAGSVGLCLGTLCRSCLTGAALTVLALLLLQIPLGFYGILSSPQVEVGLILACLALARLLAPAAVQTRLSPLATAALAFGAGCMNECFFPPLLLGAAYACWISRQRAQPLAAGVALGGYLALYLIFRHRWPSRYPGTQVSFAPREVAHAALVYVGSTFPGIELLFRRHGYTPSVLWKSGPEIRFILGQFRWQTVPLLATGYALLGALVLRAVKTRPHLPPWALLVLTAMAVSFVGPISLTFKYQTWSHLRQYPYFYSMCSWYFLLAVALLLVLQGLQRAESRAAVRRLAGPAVAVATAVLIAAVWASNFQVTGLLEKGPYPIADADYQILGPTAASPASP